MDIARRYVRQFLSENKKPAEDSEYYKRKVLDNPDNLEYVPDELKTPELCKLAVEKDRWALKYVPDKLKTPELCKIAIENNGSILEFVPDKLKTPELCKLAVDNEGSALPFVPDHLKEQVEKELRMK